MYLAIGIDSLTKTSGTVSRSDWIRDLQIAFMRGFFSDGPSSNRGDPPREIGPHGIIPFVNPGQTSAQIAAQYTSGSPNYGAPTLQFAEWIHALESQHRAASFNNGTAGKSAVHR